jgi:hypothetical protein
MLAYYFGNELRIATFVAFGLLGLNVIGVFFLPLARKTIGYTLLLLSLVLVLALARYQYQLAVFGARAEGKVVDLAQVLPNTPGGHQEDQQPGTITYRPVVDFTTTAGQPVEFKAQQDANQGVYAVGQTVAVRYMPAHPGFAEVDSWPSLWRPLLLGSLFDWGLCAGGILLIRRFGFGRRPAARRGESSPAAPIQAG